MPCDTATVTGPAQDGGDGGTGGGGNGGTGGGDNGGTGGGDNGDTGGGGDDEGLSTTAKVIGGVAALGGLGALLSRGDDNG